MAFHVCFPAVVVRVCLCTCVFPRAAQGEALRKAPPGAGAGGGSSPSTPARFPDTAPTQVIYLCPAQQRKFVHTRRLLSAFCINLAFY